MRTYAIISKGKLIEKGGTFEGRYRLASLSKQFTAAGVIRQHSDIDIDISHFFHGFPSGITIRDCILHTSGLPDYEDFWTSSEQIVDKEVVKILKNHASERFFSPGKGFRYNNGGYCILREIMELQGGFEGFMQEQIFLPLGIYSACFYREGVEIENRVFGHAQEGDMLVEKDQSPTSATQGDGGLYMNMEEYLRWLFSVQPSTIQVPAEAGLSYSLGWFITPEGHLLHTGSSCGFSHAVRIDLTEMDAFVYFSALAEDHQGALELEKKFTTWKPYAELALSLTR
jgi:D-alanyl-D-alanine carboxypeptidase